MSNSATTSTTPSTPTDQRKHNVTVLIGRAYHLPDGYPATEVWATPDMDAYSFEAIYDPNRISLTRAENRVRRQLAEYGTQVTEFLNEDGPLTTAQRTLVLDDGLGAWRTEPVETQLRDIDDQRTRAENAETSFLAAEVVMTDYRSQAYGRQTEVWLRYGITVGSLTPARAREALDAIKGFVPYLEAVVELAEEIGSGDFEGDPEIAAADREAETRRHRAITEARA